MILLVFEGPDDQKLMESALKLFNFDKEKSICIFRGDIYALYSKLKAYDIFDSIENSGNTVSILREILHSRGNNELDNISDSDISEIYLFFDFDFQNRRLSLEEINQRVSNMVNFFSNETENGKLYINYPMIEAIRYTKELPDIDYNKYTVKRSECSHFKNIVHQFSHYPTMDHLLLHINANESEQKAIKRREAIRLNWVHMIKMSIRKMNFLCFDEDVELDDLDRFKLKGIPLELLLKSELKKHVSKTESEVSIISSLPLFIYDYFGPKVLKR